MKSNDIFNGMLSHSWNLKIIAQHGIIFANNYVLVEYSYLLGEKNPEMAIVCDSE